MARVPFVLIAALLALAAPALAQLQPATHASPSGLWRLHVEPIERTGTSGADYSMTFDGIPVWEARHPFVLWEACVTDEGRAGGIAYVGAVPSSWNGGRLDVVVFSPDGDVLLRESHERTMSPWEHTPANPRARGLFPQHWFDQMVVRVVDEDPNRSAEGWWTYDLKSGKCLRRDPMSDLLGLEEVRGCLDAREVPGTPLTLVHWLHFPRTAGSLRGSRFDLVDGQDQVVWTLELPKDYVTDRPTARALREGGLLEVGPGRFELWHFAEDAAVSYEVSVDAAGTWNVRETGRRPTEGGETPPVLAAAIRPASPRGVVLGGPPPPAGPIRDVLALGFGPDGSVRFARKEEDGWSLVRVDETGAVLAETAVSLPAEEKAVVRWFALPGGRWVATHQVLQGAGKTPAWLVDEEGGKPVDLPSFPTGAVKRVLALSGDRWVVLTKGVDLFDRTEGRSSPFASSTQGARDVAVTSDGRVVVLDSRGAELRIHSDGGELLDTIDLEEAWGVEPRYPVRVVARAAGGVVVQDFNSDVPLWCMNLDGTLCGRFDTRPPVGPGLEEYRRELRFGPDGRMWTTDGHAIALLDETGRATRALGASADPSILRAPGSCAIDSTFGRALILDARGRALHVFDAEGQRVLLGVPDPADLEPLRFPLRMGCDSRGGAWAAEGRHTAGHVRFDSDGESQGMTRLERGAVFRPGSEAFWGVREDLVVRRGGGEDALDLEKTPDGRWWRDVVDLAVAADGRLAVLDVPAMNGYFREEGPGLVAWYDPDGEPLGQAEIPAALRVDHLAFAGSWILLSGFSFPAWLLDTRDGALHPLEPPMETEGIARLGLSPDGTELWALEPEARTLWRCPLP